MATPSFSTGLSDNEGFGGLLGKEVGEMHGNLGFGKAARLRPDLEGIVVAEFRVLPQGSVTGVRAAGVSDEVARCVADVLETINFPRAKTLSKIHYPFTFRPAGT